MKAITTLARIALDKIELRPIGEQLEIYEALSQVMPSKADRKKAERIAWMLKEAASMQLEFTTLLKAA